MGGGGAGGGRSCTIAILRKWSEMLLDEGGNMDEQENIILSQVYGPETNT